VFGQLLNRMGLPGGNQEHIPWPQGCLLVIHHKEDLPFCHIGDLLVRMRMGRVGLVFGAVVKVYDHNHQVIGVPQPTLGSLTDLLCGHLIVFQSRHIASLPAKELQPDRPIYDGDDAAILDATPALKMYVSKEATTCGDAFEHAWVDFSVATTPGA
jgi:hypothetical protein